MAVVKEESSDAAASATPLTATRSNRISGGGRAGRRPSLPQVDMDANEILKVRRVKESCNVFFKPFTLY